MINHGSRTSNTTFKNKNTSIKLKERIRKH